MRPPLPLRPKMIPSRAQCTSTKSNPIRRRLRLPPSRASATAYPLGKIISHSFIHYHSIWGRCCSCPLEIARFWTFNLLEKPTGLCCHLIANPFNDNQPVPSHYFCCRDALSRSQSKGRTIVMYLYPTDEWRKRRKHRWERAWNGSSPHQIPTKTRDLPWS